MEINSLSFMQRRSDERRLPETRLIANWVAENLVSRGARLFIVSGSTACETAAVILRQHHDVHVHTNSVPVAWEFMQMTETRQLAPNATVSIMGGELRAVTGAIAGHVESEEGVTLIFAPHGLTEKAITGNRDVDEIKALVDGHQKIIMLVSWTKLGRPGRVAVKHYGHWKQVDCQLVVTNQPHPTLGLTEEQKERGEAILETMTKAMGDRLKVHRVPLVE